MVVAPTVNKLVCFSVDEPSLQAFRAETMVERFTARMHVGSQHFSGRFVLQCFLFCFVFAFVCLYVRGLACCFVRFFVFSFVCFVVISVTLALVWFFCARMPFRCICVVRCVSLLFACNHSTSPPGGNQVDGLPPALHVLVVVVGARCLGKFV